MAFDCPHHGAHALTLPVGRACEGTKEDSIEITVTLEQAWTNTTYSVDVTTEDLCTPQLGIKRQRRDLPAESVRGRDRTSPSRSRVAQPPAPVSVPCTRGPSGLPRRRVASIPDILIAG